MQSGIITAHKVMQKVWRKSPSLVASVEILNLKSKLTQIWDTIKSAMFCIVSSPSIEAIEFCTFLMTVMCSDFQCL